MPTAYDHRVAEPSVQAAKPCLWSLVVYSRQHQFIYYFISAACPKGYSKPLYSSRSCFSVKNTALSWEEVLNSCAHDDGILASFQSIEEAHFVAKLLKGNFLLVHRYCYNTVILTYDAIVMFKCQDPFKISRKYVT